MTGRAFMGEVLIQVWLKFIKELVSIRQTSEWTERKLTGLTQAHEKVCNENDCRRKNDST